MDIAVVIFDSPVAEKIAIKHAPLTAEDVRSALVYAREVSTRWDDHEVYGRRLVARATTYGGVEFVAYLKPTNPDDPEEGTFDLKTAIPKLT